MKKIVLAPLLSLAALSTQAETLYVDVAYQIFDTELTTDPAAIRGIVGYNFDENKAIEAMYGFSVRDGEQTIYNIPTKSKVENLLGVYGKFGYSIIPALELYGRVGVARTTVTATASAGGFSATASESTTGFSFGGGIGYSVLPVMSINLEYMDYGDPEAGLAVGVRFSF